MRTLKFRILSASVLILTYIFTSILPQYIAALLRSSFLIDETNTSDKRCFYRDRMPFHEAWTWI